MGRIDDIFASHRSVGMKALMPFLCAGYPRPGMLGSLLKAAQDGGATIVEVGFPFSDPIADGPVIAGAMHTALEKGCTPAGIFDEVRAVRDSLGLGLVAMVSVSIVHRMGGPAGFCERAGQAGFDGLIVPDVTLEESLALRDACRKAGLSLSMLIAPTTSPARAAELAQASTGFVYLLARAGITGEQSSAPKVGSRVAQLRQATQLPIAVGFGLSTAQHVSAAVSEADAAIVGSALVRVIGEASATGKDPVAATRAFVRSLAEGLLPDTMGKP